ncbi:tryptophan synthase subunit alpha [Brooklawnia cerclae]|uniref:Tryptophan synthase alpha chain n=1 Tax=Brooklawnia cerclae TaxID=349934 RepID=A0ABX0SDL6_9ACTN|nr:tryptophan synthase subunit alpha [Brooklawnia cerclae]NIH56479.1 tryptophan synthase alpha chain [Brooklawnia cerclae]
MSTTVDPRLGISGHVLRDAKAAGRAALVGYLPVGYPDVDHSIEAMRALAQGTDGIGVDMVEIGMPYSDPMMDGLAIQHATTRALERGVRTHDVFRAVEAVAVAGAVPLVMIYWNLVEQYGVEAFARDLAAAGGAGLITPDLTPDEAGPWLDASDAQGLDRVFLIAPSSTDERIAMTMANCRGWVYATSVMGVTGVRTQTSSAAPVIVDRARAADPSLPVGVGLGVSNGDQASVVGSYADAVIVGSALVKCLIDAEDAGSADLVRLRERVADLAAGVRRPVVPDDATVRGG